MRWPLGTMLVGDSAANGNCPAAHRGRSRDLHMYGKFLLVVVRLGQSERRSRLNRGTATPRTYQTNNV